MATYRSRRIAERHPGVTSLVGAALTRPLGVCMLPVMVGALLSMLTGRAPLPYLLYGFPAAAVIAWFWTVHHLKSDIVEIETDGAVVTVRTLWDLAARRRRPDSGAVLDVRRTDGELLVTLGLDTFRLVRAEWPRPDELEDDLRLAAESHVDRVRHRMDSIRGY